MPSFVLKTPIQYNTICNFVFVNSQCLVFAGIGDLNRPVEKLSVPQSGALMATGLIFINTCDVDSNNFYSGLYATVVRKQGSSFDLLYAGLSC